jgi:hypothetical protein
MWSFVKIQKGGIYAQKGKPRQTPRAPKIADRMAQQQQTPQK